MARTLFDNKTDISYVLSDMAVDLDVFKDKDNDTNDALKRLSRKIDLDAKQVFDYFFERNAVPVSEMPQYYCSPIWNSAYNSYKWRYMVVVYNGVFFLVFLRIVGVMYHQQYFSLSYRVLSSSGNRRETLAVEKTLCSLKSIKSFETIVDEDDWDCINFYNDTMPTANNWKVNHANALVGIGLNATVHIGNIPSHLLVGIRNLYEFVRKEHFDFNISRQDKYMNTVLKLGVTPVFVFTFNGKVVGIKIVSNDFSNVVYIHSAKDVSSLSIETIALNYACGDVNVARDLKRFLGTYEERFVNDYLLNKMGFCAVFNDGLIDKAEKGLYEHKAEHYKKTIRYKIERL